MIVLDASVLIAHFDRADPHHQRATALLAQHHQDTFVASVITIAEFLVGPSRAGTADDAIAALQRLQVSTTALDADAADQLARMRAETGLRLPDCCVLRLAAINHASMASFDDRLMRVARNRGLAVIGTTT